MTRSRWGRLSFPLSERRELLPPDDIFYKKPYYTRNGSLIVHMADSGFTKLSRRYLNSNLPGPNASSYSAMATSPTPVPLSVDTENQIYVTVHALLAGELWLPYNMVYQDSVHEPREIGCQVPDFAFMITHPTHGRALFDLGMRKVSIM